MDWSRPYSAKWRAYEVDRDTWADGAMIQGAYGATIEHDATSDAPLIDSGTIQIDTFPNASFGERYVRLVMVAEQDDDKARVEVATLLCTSSHSTISRGSETMELDGRSVLYPASVAVMDRGAYVPKKTNCVEWCRARLSEVLHAPVVASGSFTLSDDYVADMGTTVLAAVWEVLGTGGWTIQIDGHGTVRIRKLPAEPSLELSRANVTLLQPSVTLERDWSEVPNRYIAVDADGSRGIATNTWKSSPTSTVTRGYRHDVMDTSPALVDGETIGHYARRKLEELSTIPDRRTYSREWYPDVLVGSLVRGSVASVGLDGDLRVERQSLTCGAGIVVSEQASKEVKAWTA